MVMISGICVRTASLRRKFMAESIREACSKSPRFSLAERRSFVLGGFGMNRFPLMAVEPQHADGDARLAAHIGELLRRHRDRHRAALVPPDHLDRSEILHLDAGALEHAAVNTC